MYFYTLYQTTNQGDLITTPSYKPFKNDKFQVWNLFFTAPEFFR